MYWLGSILFDNVVDQKWKNETKVSFFLGGDEAFKIHELKLKQERWLYTNTRFHEMVKQIRVDPD